MKAFKSLLFLLLALLIVQACKKDSSSSPTKHQLTYKISSNNYQPLSYVTYNDSTNSFVVTSAVDSTSGWTKTTTVTAPFTALLEVQGINNSADTLKYTLEIDQDNSPNAQQQESIMPFNSFDTQVNAAIQ
jgi:ABC-type oligopeptide transport system substrate-binding subunit